MWKLGSDGNRIERKVSSSDAVDPSSDLELVSESMCDDFLAVESCSKGCDIASFRVQECWQVSAACTAGDKTVSMLQGLGPYCL